MRTGAHNCRMHLLLAVMFVACAIFCFANAASAQQPAAKVQAYTDLTHLTGQMVFPIISADGSTILARGTGNFRWSQSGGTERLGRYDGRYYAYLDVVSANGAVVAGTCASNLSTGSDEHVFLWSKAGGFRDLIKLRKGDNVQVSFVANDGSIAVWSVGLKNDFHLIRWSASGGARDLGKSGAFLWVDAVSADGSEIVGDMKDGNLVAYRGFRWTEQGGFQEFPAMDKPLSISADGSAIVGVKGDRVIRWTDAGGAQELGSLKTDGKNFAHPQKGSADGRVVVGWLDAVASETWITPGRHAFLWTQDGGMQDLGLLGGKSAMLVDVSADGTVVAGNSDATFVSPVADLVAKRQAELKVEQAAKQAQEQAKAAAQAEEQAKKAAVEADQQARYDRVIKTGRPAQLYSLAGHMEDEGRPDLAANLYQALIDKFPDDPYTAKAIDKEDAARAAAAQQQQQAQDPAGQTAANAASPQAVEACLQQCSTTLSSCKSDAQNQHDSAVAKGLVGLLTRNSGAVGGAATDAQSADDAKSACEDAYNSCSTACQ